MSVGWLLSQTNHKHHKIIIARLRQGQTTNNASVYCMAPVRDKQVTSRLVVAPSNKQATNITSIYCMVPVNNKKHPKKSHLVFGTNTTSIYCMAPETNNKRHIYLLQQTTNITAIYCNKQQASQLFIATNNKHHIYLLQQTSQLFIATKNKHHIYLLHQTTDVKSI